MSESAFFGISLDPCGRFDQAANPLAERDAAFLGKTLGFATKSYGQSDADDFGLHDSIIHGVVQIASGEPRILRHATGNY